MKDANESTMQIILRLWAEEEQRIKDKEKAKRENKGA